MPDHLIGKRFREYLILDLLGNGGMAKVYKARHVLLDEIRAIKIIRPELSNTDRFVARFRREAKILARLKNRHLVTLHDFGTMGQDLLFIVMEYLEGESLKDRIRRMGWLSVWECIEIAKQISVGLQAVHRQGVVHRDVSPGNILLVPEDGEEVAKLIDFGIAKSMSPTASTKITGTLEIIGKAAYCSPEQIQSGSAEGIDGRSDIYSLGVTFFEMLTGEKPFDSKNAQGFLTMHLQDEPRTLAEANDMADVPPGIARLVMRMLRKDRSDRPGSAEELHAELSALHNELPRPALVH